MNYDDDWTDPAQTRIEMARKTIRPATAEELKALCQQLFPVVTDPWAEKFNAFLTEHAHDRFFLADAPGGARIAYCKEAGKGIWFLPGTGVGIIQPKGLQALAEITGGL